jgi:hypothetical protein
MVGTNYATPSSFFGIDGSNRLVSDHGLTGSADATRINFDSALKVGATYARRSPEYCINGANTWTSTTISCSQGIRVLRVTGSRVFAGDSEYTVDRESGLEPVQKSYSDYVSDIRVVGQEYSIIPEFKISDHMDYYLNQQGGNFLADRSEILNITGSALENSSTASFYTTYSHTDFLKYFDIFKDDHKDLATPSNLKMKCQAVMKFLPYDGFYPSERTLQLAALFSQSYGDHVRSKGWQSKYNSGWRAFFTPMFAPGLLYNSIKSGMAVDYPIYADNYPDTLEDYKSGVGYFDFREGGWEHFPNAYATPGTRGIYGFALSASAHQWISNTDVINNPSPLPWDHTIQVATPWALATSSYHVPETTDGTVWAPTSLDSSASWATCLASPFTKRLPFEALVEPEAYLAKATIWDAEPDYSASLRQVLTDPSTNQAAFWGGRGKINYKLAMHNFLAAIPEMFLNNKKFTTFTSKPVNPSGVTITNDDSNNFFGMDVSISNCQCHSLTDFRQRSNLPEYATTTNIFHLITHKELEDVKGINTQIYSRDSAFGPPWVYPDSLFTSSQNCLTYHYSYEPFTPSYFNGYGVARMLFYPFKGPGNYTVEEIQSNLTMSYMRMPTDRLNAGGNWSENQLLDYTTKISVDQNLLTAKEHSASVASVVDNAFVYCSASSNWQQLSSSVNLLEVVKVKNVLYEKGVVKDYTPAQFSDDPNNVNTIWVIQPKWETPILNFYNKITSSVVNGQGSGSVAKGLWHQYGDYCNNSEGMWLNIQDIPNSALYSKGYEAGVSTPHEYIFTGQSENKVSLKKTNASCELFIRDYSLIKGLTLNIDGCRLVEGGSLVGPDIGHDPCDWKALSSNYETALSIVAAITCSIGDRQGAALSGSNPAYVQLRHRVSASLFVPQSDHPWKDNAGASNEPVVGIKFEILDYATNKDYGWADFIVPKIIPYQNATDLDYPDYYASGELGNSKTIVLENSSGADVKNSGWLLRSGDVVDTKVNFSGGASPQYDVKSLADLLGFPKTRKRMGEFINETIIKEAVVAVPFIENSGRRRFFNVSRRAVDLVLGNKNPVDGETVGTSVAQMVLALRDYVLPPKMDFITNETIDPIAMYVFEFEQKLTKDDLKNIWQNLPPQIGLSFETKEAVIEHPLLTKELLAADSLSNLRWMVFKVKQKAPWNYYELTADTTDDARFKFDQFKDNGGIPPYSYNWPFDFCSIVELAKIGAEVTFIKGTAPVGDTSDNGPDLRDTSAIPMTNAIVGSSNRLNSMTAITTNTAVVNSSAGRNTGNIGVINAIEPIGSGRVAAIAKDVSKSKTATKSGRKDENSNLKDLTISTTFTVPGTTTGGPTKKSGR